MSELPEALPQLDIERCWPITWSHASEYNPFDIVRSNGGVVLEAWGNDHADHPIVSTVADISALPDLDPRVRLAMTVQSSWPGDNFFAEPLERLADIEPFVASDKTAHMAVTSLMDRMRALRDEALGAWLDESRTALAGLGRAAYVRLLPEGGRSHENPGVLARLHEIGIADEDSSFYRGFTLQLAGNDDTVGTLPAGWQQNVLYLPVEDE